MKKIITGIFCIISLVFSGSIWTVGDYYDDSYIRNAFNLLVSYGDNIYFDRNFGSEARDGIEAALIGMNDIYNFFYKEDMNIDSPYINKVIFLSPGWFNNFLMEDENIIDSVGNLIFISRSDDRDEHETYNILINLDRFNDDKAYARSCINAVGKLHNVIENEIG